MVAMRAQRSYGGVPAAERRVQRRDRLVETVLDIVGQDGVAALTVNRICRGAGLNERYFYESFTSTDDALLAAAERMTEALLTAVLTALGGADSDPRAAATRVIGAGVDLLVEDPRLGALLLASASEPALVARRQVVAQGLVALIREQGMVTLHVEPTPETESWAEFAATLLLGGLLETLSAWTRGQLRITRDELVERNVEAFLAIADRWRELLER